MGVAVVGRLTRCCQNGLSDNGSRLHAIPHLHPCHSPSFHLFSIVQGTGMALLLNTWDSKRQVGLSATSNVEPVDGYQLKPCPMCIGKLRPVRARALEKLRGTSERT